MPAAQADSQLASGQVLAILTVPKGFTSDLRGLEQSPKLILRTTRGGLSTRVVEKLRSFVYSTNLDLQKAYIEANLSAVNLLLHGGGGVIGKTRFSLLGVRRARAELAVLARSPDPAVAARAKELGTFMNQLNGAVGQVGTFLRATANPIQLVHVSQGGRSWILSAQVQAYALALALAFVAVLLGAGAIVAEREENVLGRLVGGLAGFGRLVAEKIAFVTLIAAGLGLLLALVFGLIVELGHVSGGQPWQRVPLLLAGLLLAAAAFGAFGVLVGALAREAGTATLVAFLVALPLTLVALVPQGTAPVVAWIGALFPFGHAVHAFTVALYDTHPAGAVPARVRMAGRARTRLRPRGPDGGAAAALREARGPLRSPRARCRPRLLGRDRNSVGLRLDRLRRVELQHALREDGLHLRGVRLGRKLEAAQELAVEPLVQTECLLVLLLGLLPRALDGQHVVDDLDVEILLVEAGDLELHDELVGSLVDVGGGNEHGDEAPRIEDPPCSPLHRIELAERNQRRCRHEPTSLS